MIYFANRSVWISSRDLSVCQHFNFHFTDWLNSRTLQTALALLLMCGLRVMDILSLTFVEANLYMLSYPVSCCVYKELLLPVICLLPRLISTFHHNNFLPKITDYVNRSGKRNRRKMGMWVKKWHRRIPFLCNIISGSHLIISSALYIHNSHLHTSNYV